MKDMPADLAVIPPQPRDYHGVNWAGFQTLYLREIKRFWKVGTQTLAAPVVTSLLYMMVFVAAGGQGGSGRTSVHGVPYASFVAPGLIMMSILNNAFANSSSSLLQAKMNGLIGDFLTPPLTPPEHVAAFSLGAATRGILVGSVTWIAVAFFTHVPVTHLWAILYFGIGAAVILGLLGVMAGLWSEKFDHMAVVTNFIIMPMTFLSGTFYLVERLPGPFRVASHYNPFFYLIDGFRYGFLGSHESSITAGVAMTAGLIVALTSVCLWMFESGYKIKT
jgi:ABC-2 type transport system permease protein